jgi:hypothetical protein
VLPKYKLQFIRVVKWPTKTFSNNKLPKTDDALSYIDNLIMLFQPSEPSSSFSATVSVYGLHDRVIEVRSPVEAKDFSSSLSVQTGTGTHPACCTYTRGTGGPSPETKVRTGRDADHSLPSSAEVITSPPQAPAWRVVGQF